MGKPDITPPFYPEISFPWYQILQNPEKLKDYYGDIKRDEYIKKYNEIEQGDFIFNCEILKPTLNQGASTIEADSLDYDVIILSQSCDLIQGKVELVTVAPLWSLKEIEDKNDFFKSSKGKESLRKGFQPNYHLLNEFNSDFINLEYKIVDFRQIFGVPIEQITGYVRNADFRLRLLSPYKEHLAQAFARFFMRVGLPVDIPIFKKKK